jgi:hypothetical protein
MRVTSGELMSTSSPKQKEGKTKKGRNVEKFKQ